MLIEIFGVPGSGKSTYVDQYIRQNRYSINPLTLYLYNTSRVRQNINKVLLVLYFFIRKPVTMVLILRKFRVVKFRSVTTRVKMFLYLFSVISCIERCRRKYKSITCIIDEGINQVIWGITYNSYNSEGEIKTLHQTLLPYLADEVMYIKIGKKEVKHRLLQREGKGGSELQVDIKLNDEKLDYAFFLADQILDRIKGYKNTKVSTRKF